MTVHSRLHKNDKLWGAVAEALVAAYALISAAGKLTSFRPFSDVDGKDIVIDLEGEFKNIYLQVKCALGVTRYHRIGGTVRWHRHHVPSDPKLFYVFCLLDRRRMELTRLWVIPSAIFHERAYRTPLSNGQVQFNFDCRSSGDPKWDEFEVTKQELGPRLVALIRSATRRPRPAGGRLQVVGRWLEIAA